MNRLARWMMRLYPARWRRRYGDEVDALVSDAGADGRVVADLLKGAVRMQFATWSFPRLAAVLGLAGALAGLAYSFLTPVKYVARAELGLTGADSIAYTSQMLGSLVTSRANVSVIITDRAIDLYRKERETTPLADVIDQMRPNVVFRPDGPQTIAIQFTYPEAAKARAAVQAIAKIAVEQMRSSTKLQRTSAAKRTIEVFDPATLPTVPLRPDRLPLAIAGLVTGLLLAALWQLKSRRRRYVSFSLIGALAGTAIAYLIPSIAGIFPDDFTLLRYESHAVMYARNVQPIAEILTEITSRAALAAIIEDPRVGLYRTELQNHSLEDVAGDMRRSLSVATRPAGSGAQWIDISFTFFDRHKSEQVVNAVMHRISDEDRFIEAASPAVTPETKWGEVVPGSQSRVTVESVAPDRMAALLPGLFAGLILAAIIAMVRRRWVDEGEFEPPSLRRLPSARFRGFAFLLIVAGAACGWIFLLLTPARYVSDALITFDNMSPSRAATLIDNSATKEHAGRDLSWQTVKSGGLKTNAFHIQYIASEALRARSVLQRVLGDIDHGITNLRGNDDNPFEKIRGVDGALLPVDTLPLTPATNAPERLAIPFDDERAHPVPQPEFLAVKMNLIDAPNLPERSEGIGLWSIAIGAASGFVLAILISLVGGRRGWPYFEKKEWGRQPAPLR